MAKSCVYNGQEYSDGSVVCQAGTKHQCRDGSWDDLGSSCTAEQDGVLIGEDYQTTEKRLEDHEDQVD